MATYETSHQSLFTISRFRDGDTVEGFLVCSCCRCCSQEVVRLPKIESWETQGPERAKAIECARRLTDKFRGVSGHIITKQPTRDRYGRMITDIIIGDMLLSDWIVNNGLAWYGVGEHIHGAFQLPPASTNVDA